MKNIIKFSTTTIITMLLCIIIAPSAFAEDTVYTTSDVTGGIRIDSVTTTETVLEIPAEIDGKVVVALGAKAFKDTPVEEITVPSGVTSMYNSSNGSTFYGMENIKKVTFSEGMKTIPEGALKNCSTVTEVVLPESLTAISDEAFYGCTSLTAINLPDSITTIGQKAFYDCTSLENIELPEKLESLGIYSFMNCTEIDSVILHDALKTIGAKAFSGTKIAEIIIPANVTSMYKYSYGSALEGMQYLEKVTFADGMKTVPEDALLYCSTVTEVILPESLTTISNEAFYGCTSLTTINLPDRITKISDEAFYGCTSLTTINLPDSITTIGQKAFYNCTSLENIELPEKLESLGIYSFMNCTKIDSVILPDALKTIGAKSFSGTKIAEIIIPANVTSMYKYSYGSALEGMQHLEKVTFAEGMRTVPEDALLSCSTVTEVILPESLTTISDEAFYGCTSLTTINLPDRITTIGQKAFYNCTSLENVELPEKLESLGMYSFMNCTKIDSVILPDALKTIGAKSFSGTKIAEIIIPANVTSMYRYSYGSALEGMQYLEKVTFADGMVAVPSNALYNCKYLEEVVIYDCNESLEEMKAAAEENDYTLTVLSCGECQHENTEIRNAVAVTCIENGYTGDTYCTDCDALITEGEIINAVGSHNYESETVKNATCSAEGEVKYTCSVCGDNYTESTEKDNNNHTGGTEIRDRKDASCTEKGYTGDTYCKGCNVKLESGHETEKTAHTESVVTGKNATCTETGLTDGTKCSVCGEILKAQEEIPAKGHSYGDWTVVKAATADEEGLEERYCTSCGEAETRTIDKISYIVGDINGDGRITAADARLALRIAAHIDTIENLGTTLVVCDITFDNKVTAADARIILRKAAGLE